MEDDPVSAKSLLSLVTMLGHEAALATTVIMGIQWYGVLKLGWVMPALQSRKNPPLDALLIASANSLIVILVSVQAKRPLDFSVFPTVILATTMLRLTLNVASTRVVLLHGHQGPTAAGEVIHAFGDFVIGGSCACSSCADRGGRSRRRWRGAVQAGLLRLPRHRGRQCAQARRQGRMGAAHQARHAGHDAVGPEGYGRLAAEGRLDRAGRRRAGRR